MNRIKATLLGIVFGFFAIYMLQTGSVSAQVHSTNNQSGNATLSNGTTTNQSNTGSNNTVNAFDSLKDTFGSLFGK